MLSSPTGSSGNISKKPMKPNIRSTKMNRKEFEAKYNGSSDDMFKDALSVFDSLEAKLKEDKASRYYDSVMGAV